MTHAQLIVQADGGARGNPGPAAIGVVITTPAGVLLYEKGEVIGHATNNQAEYRALIHAFGAARQFEPTVLDIRLDSQLVVEQMKGNYRVRNAQIKPLWEQAQASATALGAQITYTHVERRLNAHADRLVNEALDGK